MTSLPRQTAGRKGGKPAPNKTIARRKTIPYDQRQQRLSLGSHTAPPSPVTVASYSSITTSQSPQTNVVPSGMQLELELESEWNTAHFSVFKCAPIILDAILSNIISATTFRSFPIH